MPKLKVIKAFSWAHEHVHVKEYAKGDVIDTEDKDLIRVSKEEGWVSKDKDAKPGAVAETAAAAEAKAELEKDISALEIQITSASEVDAPALQAELDAKRQALADL